MGSEMCIRDSSNSDESTQIAVQLFSEIESFEINTPNRKTLQFLLRNSQLVAKNSISAVLPSCILASN